MSQSTNCALKDHVRCQSPIQCDCSCHKPVSPSTNIDAKACTSCGVVQPPSEFSIMIYHGRIYPCTSCKECRRVYSRKHYEANKAHKLKQNKEYDLANWQRIREAAYRYRLKDPNKSKARSAVRYAVNTGKLKRGVCERCSTEKTDFHHSEGYEKDKWLTGVWLCRKCHAQAHKELRWTA